MMVSGTNYLGENIISNKYVYSQHYLIWGWATWKRAWQSYDVSMKNWLDENVKNKIKKRYNKLEYKFLNEKFNSFFFQIIQIPGTSSGTFHVLKIMD